MTSHINIALLGSKFMGRAHSNAWLNVGEVLRRRSASRRCTPWSAATTTSSASSPSGGAGNTTRPTGMRRSRPMTSGSSTSAHPTTCTPNRRSPPSRPASTSPARSRSPERWRCPGDGRRRSRGARHDVGLVQLPAGAGRRPGPPPGGRRQDRSDLPRACLLPAELGRPGHAAAVAVPGRHRRLRCPRRPQRPHHRLRQVRHGRGDRHRRGSDRAHVHRGTRRPRRRDGWRDRRRRRQHHGQQGARAPSTTPCCSSPD